MSQHVYDGFGSKENRARYVCKSDINGKLLEDFHFENWFTVSEVIDVFDMIRNSEKYILVRTGNIKNPHKQRRTKFVKKEILYNEVLDYYFDDFPMEYRIIFK